MKTTRYVIIFLNDIIEVENPQKIAQSSRSNKKNFLDRKPMLLWLSLIL